MGNPRKLEEKQAKTNDAFFSQDLYEMVKTSIKKYVYRNWSTILDDRYVKNTGI